MTALGMIAAGLAFACIGVLVHDLWYRHTAFAQFAAGRRANPRLFRLGIAAWSACLLGSTIVALEDLGLHTPENSSPRTIIIRASQP